MKKRNIFIIVFVSIIVLSSILVFNFLQSNKKVKPIKINYNITNNIVYESLSFLQNYKHKDFNVIPKNKNYKLNQSPLTKNCLLNVEKKDDIMYLTEDVSIYNSFSNKSKVILNLEKTTEVKRIMSYSNGWDKILYNETIGYLPYFYLTTNKPIIQIAQIMEQLNNPTATQNNTEPPANISYFCQSDGYVDASWLGMVDTQLSMIPDYVLNAFKNDGWNIYVTSMNIDQAYYGGQYGAVMASTNYNEYRIIVEDRYDAITEAPIHEMGHWLDWHFGKQSWSDEFGNIYASEYGIFTNTFPVTCMMNQEELFAEGFWRYIISRDSLQSSCPMLYNYIDNKVSQL